jgi:hypothetical protein
MTYRSIRVGTMAMAAAGIMGAYVGSATAEPGPTPATFKQVTYKTQDQEVDKLIAASNMTKDNDTPARAYTGPSVMAVDPENPRIVVAATADLRTKVCQLTVSKDAGRTWHFSESPPSDPAFPWCTNTSAGTPHAAVAFGKDGALYYSHMAYGEGDGAVRETRSSMMLAKTTDLGKKWTTTMVENNRGTTGPQSRSVSSAPGLAVDTSGPRDIVYVGYSISYPDAPTNDPLRLPHVVVATSVDGGATFGAGFDLNSIERPSLTINAKALPLYMRSGFGAPLVYAHDGVLLAVASSDFAPADAPQPPPEAGAGLNPGSWYAYPTPQLIARSTDNGKTWKMTALGDPILAGTGVMTGLGWTPKGGDNGTFVAAYGASPETSPTIALVDIVVQRSTDGGVTWTSPLALDDDPPEMHATGFYPQMNVAPNGRVDVVWTDDRDVSDYHFNERYTYSTDGGLTWAKNVLVSDKPINFNYGVSYNSDIRQPNGIASANSYAIIGWADTRNANDVSQAQDNYSAAVQFGPLPATKNTTAPVIAAIFGGLVLAGIVLLLVNQMRKRPEGPAAAASTSRVAAGA